MVTFIDWLKKRYKDLHVHPTLVNAKEKVSDKLKKKRQPFSNDQLSIIFESEEALSIRRRHPFQAWLPVLGLYTGARRLRSCYITKCGSTGI